METINVTLPESVSRSSLLVVVTLSHHCNALSTILYSSIRMKDWDATKRSSFPGQIWRESVGQSWCVWWSLPRTGSGGPGRNVAISIIMIISHTRNVTISISMIISHTIIILFKIRSVSGWARWSSPTLMEEWDSCSILVESQQGDGGDDEFYRGEIITIHKFIFAGSHDDNDFKILH